MSSLKLLYEVTLRYSFNKLKGLGKFEKYDTVTRETISIMKKLFFAVFINMGVLVIIINGDLHEFKIISLIHENIPLGDYVFNGEYSDFQREW
jgi:hypothetical protein